MVIDGVRNVAIWTWDITGEAFGNTPPNQDPDGDSTSFVFNLRYPGQRYDSATELNYNYFRDYDPATGRYVESDPLGLDAGPTTYGYALLNPLMSSDAGANYALLSGWWCAAALTRGAKGTRMEWVIAVAIALVISAYNLIVNLEARELNGSSLFLFVAGAIFVVSPLVAALLLDFLLRALPSSKAIATKT